MVRPAVLGRMDDDRDQVRLFRIQPGRGVAPIRQRRCVGTRVWYGRSSMRLLGWCVDVHGDGGGPAVVVEEPSQCLAARARWVFFVGSVEGEYAYEVVELE